MNIYTQDAGSNASVTAVVRLHCLGHTALLSVSWIFGEAHVPHHHFSVWHLVWLSELDLLSAGQKTDISISL